MWSLGSEPRRHRLPGVAAAVVAAGLMAGSGLAAFAPTPVSGSNNISSASMAAPTGLSAARGACVVLTSTQVNLSWTATSSTFADGYRILRSGTSGGPYTAIATVSGQSTTTYSDTTVAFSTTYYYVVEATRNLWRSATSSQASVTTQTIACV